MRITLFEHESRPLSILSSRDGGWTDAHTAALEALNTREGAEILTVSRSDLKAHQFVGILRFNDLEIEILPKIDYEVPAPESSAVQNLMHMLAYAYDLELKHKTLATLTHQGANWVDLLTRLFVQELHLQLLQGMERHYISVEEELPILRGKWRVVDQLVRHPFPGLGFEVTYDEFSENTLLNQVFRQVLDQMTLMTQAPHILQAVHGVRNWFIGIPRTSRIDLNAVRFTRLNDRFHTAFNLARLFLEHHAPALRIGDLRAYAFVFDMNRLFELFVGNFLRKHQGAIWGDAVSLFLQGQGHRLPLLQLQPDDQAVFQLIPDLVFRALRNQKPALIADTKYKRLRENEAQLGIAREDIYQMLAYGLRFDTNQLLLLYPAQRNCIRAKFQLPGQLFIITAATVNLHVSMDDPSHLKAELREILEPLLKG